MSRLSKFTYTETYNPHLYHFSGDCVVTGEKYTVSIPGEELFRYNQTGSVSSLKSLSIDDKEFVITGTSPEGWAQMTEGVEE